MPPHERNPICIKDSEHLAELIKVRFDASDARQEEIKKQVVYTNGRTRKLEDYHLEQIAWNREQSAINRELLEFIVYQKKYNSDSEDEIEVLKESIGDISRRPSITVMLQKNWIALLTIIISIAAIYVTIKSNENGTTSQHQQTNTSQHSKASSYLNGYSNRYRDFPRSHTLFGLY